MFKILSDKCSSALKKCTQKPDKTRSNSTRKAFTLAEVMIVLTIIGILSAILLPSAIHSTPDKNILKFKKAYNDFAIAIRELVSSGEYFTPGDLTLKPDGTQHNAFGCTDCANYFMISLSDVISSKSTKFSNALVNTDTLTVGISYYPNTGIKADKRCLGYKNFLTACNNCNSIELNNGVYFYEPVQNYWEMYATAGETSYANVERHMGYCIDIDGEGGVKPFGIGIRPDGKISAGPRAQWWLSRDITKKETDCCPKDLNTNGLCDESDTVCGG